MPDKSMYRSSAQKTRVTAAEDVGYVWQRDSDYQGRGRNGSKLYGCLVILKGNVVGRVRFMIVYPDGSVETHEPKRGRQRHCHLQPRQAERCAAKSWLQSWWATVWHSATAGAARRGRPLHGKPAAMSAQQIDALKDQAREAFLRHCALVDGSGGDCGLTLLATISPKVAAAAREFNAAMRQLEKLDPHCPKWPTLPEGS